MGSNGLIETIADLKQDPANARTHTARGVGMIEDALNEVGAARSIVIDELGVVLAGNATVEAAANAGIERVKVVDADGEELVAVRRSGLSESAKKRLALYDNRTGELSDWSGEVLAELQREDEALLAGLFRDDELAALLGDLADEPTEDPGAQIDKAAELQEKWQVERGQIWEIGQHRLMCGDSTSAEDMGQLMGGERAAMAFTSPPYNAGVSAQLSGNTSIDDNLYRDAYDDNQPQFQWLALMVAFTEQALSYADFVFVNLQVLAGNKQSFVEYWHHFQGHFADVAIWDKGHAQPAAAQRVMDSRFEFILVFSQDATRAIGTREFRGMVHNVYDGNPQRHNEYASSHAATFPVDLPAYFIGTFTNGGESVFDSFTGTGTTLVACEQTGRIGYGMEIEPKYCAVALERLTGMGLEARLV